MKNSLIAVLALSLSIILFSCGLSLPIQQETSISTEETASPSDTQASYEVEFNDNETFSSEVERVAAERIDPAIRQAVVLMNSVDRDHIAVARESEHPRTLLRDGLKKERSKQIYDQIEKQMSQYGQFSFDAKTENDSNFFDTVVSATDALRIDRNELFLYCDLMIRGDLYFSCYYMPGDLMNNPCDDIDAIKREVSLCDAVVSRIIDKMPDGLDNYEKCLYFTFVIACGVEYDHNEDYPLIDYQAYNAFVKGKAVCSGYAQAFDRLCREVGIASRFCKGDTDAGRHAWNMIYTDDGVVYHDITWYDSENLKDSYRQGSKNYLFMSPEDFEYYGYVQDSCQ